MTARRSLTAWRKRWRCWCGHTEGRHRKERPYCADCPGWIYQHKFEWHSVNLDAFCREKITDAFNRRRGLPTTEENRTLEVNGHDADTPNAH